ncbi:unnamed protein product [Moneuplotes crassus]|uniref:Uncharacterized protein n=1 Tax=Euplotes crassus TaxID=5936 RepID=A0AAD2D3N5_EUPCR|nr:unnamed protein product [Moneuplotes crassus]
MRRVTNLFYKEKDRISQAIEQTKEEITKMYKERDILNKKINEKSSVVKDELFVLNLRFDGVNEVKNRAKDTMELFASQIAFTKKEIEKLKNEKLERQNRKILLMNKVKTSPSGTPRGLKPTKRSKVAKKGRSRKSLRNKSKIRKSQEVSPVRSSTERIEEVVKPKKSAKKRLKTAKNKYR